MMSWELSLMFKAAVLLGAALAALRLLGRMRASRRHLVVASAFVSVMGLPLASLLVPTVEVPLQVAMVSVEPVRPAVTGLPMAPPTTARPVIAPPSRPPAAGAAAFQGLWWLGSASLLLALAGSMWKLRRLKRSAVSWEEGQTLAAAIAREAGVRRTVTVAVHHRVAAPATMGVLRPTILLPLDAPRWTAADLQRVLIHAIEHVRRGDWWTDTVARAVCILYWFNPLAWIAWRQLGVLAERACDDAVVGRTDGTDYAEQLVTLARRLSAAPRPMLSIAGRSALSIRVRAILNPQQRRGRAGAVAAACIIGASSVLAGTVASLEATALAHTRTRDVPSPSNAAMTGHVRKVEAAGTAARTSQRETAGGRNTARGPRIQVEEVEHRLPTPASVLALPEPQGLAQAPVLPPQADDPAALHYVIGTGDVLGILVSRQPELSREALVRPDGRISLPLLGEVQAAGLRPEGLRDVLTTALAKFVTNPVVTIAVKEVSARNVFIIGEVARPGMYPLNGPMTVLQLLATAGGVTNFARKDAVIIVRQVDGKSTTIPFDYAAVIAGQRLEQNVMLLPGDVVSVR